MVYLGMDVERVSELAKQLHHRVSALKSAGASTGVIVERLRTHWDGPEAADFLGEWHQRYRPAVQSAVDHLSVLARSLDEHVEAQRKVSNTSGSGPEVCHVSESNPTPTKEKIIFFDVPTGFTDHSVTVDSIPTGDGDFTLEAVQQGKLGDCYLISALGTIARDNPQFIRDHVRHNADGTWTVTLYKNGFPTEVTVDNKFSKDAATGPQGEPSFVTIYEKAVAVYTGDSYQDIWGGTGAHAMELITGGKAIWTPSSGHLDDVAADLVKGPVTVGTIKEPGLSGVAGNHEYMVDTVESRFNPDTGRDELMIHVVNPWRSSAEKGPTLGDMWLTEKQYWDNFNTRSVVDRTSYEGGWHGDTDLRSPSTIA